MNDDERLAAINRMRAEREALHVQIEQLRERARALSRELVDLESGLHKSKRGLVMAGDPAHLVAR